MDQRKAIVAFSPKDMKRRRGRSIALALALAAFVIIVFVTFYLKMSGVQQ